MAKKTVKFPSRSRLRKALETQRNRKHLKLLLSERTVLQSTPTLDDYMFDLPDQPSRKQKAFVRGLVDLSFEIREILPETNRPKVPSCAPGRPDSFPMPESLAFAFLNLTLALLTTGL